MKRMVGQDGTTVALDASTSQVAAARKFVRRALPDAVSPDVAADLQLIVSELFTNAVQHGGTERISVTVEVGPDAAAVTVDSRAEAPDVGPVDSWQVADEDEVTGRGLGIVRQVADMVRVERAGGHFAVTARRMLRHAVA